MIQHLVKAPHRLMFFIGAGNVLLAMACREAGVVLITNNTDDFDRIARVRRFDFVSAWPR